MKQIAGNPVVRWRFHDLNSLLPAVCVDHQFDFGLLSAIH